MNYECCYDSDMALWVDCLIIDSTTSPTHKFLRIEGPLGPFHAWISNQRIRVKESQYLEKSGS